MGRADLTRGFGGGAQFRSWIIPETDRKGSYFGGAEMGQRRDDRRGVEPARQERPERHIGSQAQLHRLIEDSKERCDRVGGWRTVLALSLPERSSSAASSSLRCRQIR